MSTAGQLQSLLFTYAPVSYEEYLLVINPDAGVANDLSYTQKKAADLVGQPVKYSDTYITIISFFADANEEEKIAEAIRAGIKGKIRPSFIWLDNYDCHAPSGSIFIRSKPIPYLRAIQQAIYPDLALCSAVEKGRKINIVMEPHVVVVSSNRKKIIELWEQFKDKKYENKFIADALILLKKNPAEGTCKIIAEIKL